MRHEDSTAVLAVKGPRAKGHGGLQTQINLSPQQARKGTHSHNRVELNSGNNRINLEADPSRKEGSLADTSLSATRDLEQRNQTVCGLLTSRT